MLILTLVLIFFGVILQMICNKKENKLFGIIPPIYFFIFSIIITIIFVQINNNSKFLEDATILEIMEDNGYSIKDIENYLEEGEDISNFFENYRNEMQQYASYITKVLFILLNFPTLISSIISIIIWIFDKRKKYC